MGSSALRWNVVGSALTAHLCPQATMVAQSGTGPVFLGSGPHPNGRLAGAWKVVHIAQRMYGGCIKAGTTFSRSASNASPTGTANE